MAKGENLLIEELDGTHKSVMSEVNGVVLTCNVVRNNELHDYVYYNAINRANPEESYSNRDLKLVLDYFNEISNK